MKSDPTLDALFRAARDQAPDTSRNEFGFETRLLARIREERRGSWMTIALRLSPVFAALVVAAAVLCHGYTDLDPDPSYALDAVRSGGTSALVAWLPEAKR
jgi:hypothetical protein